MAASRGGKEESSSSGWQPVVEGRRYLALVDGSQSGDLCTCWVEVGTGTDGGS